MVSMSKKIPQKLPREFKRKWIKALTSGKYKQAQEYLRYGNGYCCLGVACKIVGIPSNELLNRGLPPESPDEFEEKAGFDRVPECLRSGRRIARKLAQMNDKGISFKEIAQWIRKNL